MTARHAEFGNGDGGHAMAVNMDVLLQLPVFDFWSIPVVFTPVASQPGHAAYNGRGILNTFSLDVAGLDGSFYVDQRTILDIRESEFPVLPQQNDRLNIPLDSNNVPKGDYEIVKATSNGGGETTLEIRKWTTAAP
jgi:hypothetical protein